MLASLLNGLHNVEDLGNFVPLCNRDIVDESGSVLSSVSKNNKKKPFKHIAQNV